MWFTTFITLALLTSQVCSHGIFAANANAAAALKKNDAKRAPNACNAQAALASPIPADAAGNFAVVGQSFDKGKDGATSLKEGAVDTTAQGKTFTGKVTAVTDGDPAPANQPSTANLKLALPPSTKCAGGSDKATCLVQLTTGGGFQNCLAVTQSGAAGSGAAADASSNSTASDKSAAGSGTAGTTDTADAAAGSDAVQASDASAAAPEASEQASAATAGAAKDAAKKGKKGKKGKGKKGKGKGKKGKGKKGKGKKGKGKKGGKKAATASAAASTASDAAGAASAASAAPSTPTRRALRFARDLQIEEYE